MNKVKWVAFFQWVAGLGNEWLNRIDPKGTLRNFAHHQIETATGRKIRILIVPLGNDSRSRLRGLLLRRSIKNAFGYAVDIVSGGETLAWSGEESFDRFAQQRAQAQQLLQDYHCDVLIVRQPAPGTIPLLRLVGAENKKQATYSQIERFDLPVPFSYRSRSLFAARLFVAASQAMHVGDDLRAPLLRRFIARLPLGGAAIPQHRGLTLANEAFLFWMLGETGSIDDLKKAAKIYQDALKDINRDRDPMAWAAVQDSLGSVLRLLGERVRDSSALQQAVAAFNEALAERTRERVPMQWAATQSRLGSTLASLGAQKQTIRLEEAVNAFQAALSEWSRERLPLDWAKVQHDLGRALLLLGDQSKDTARLEQAIAAFRAALEERRHESVRPLWGITQHNLGNALLRLGEHSKGTGELHEAVTAFRAALKERNRHVFPQQWSAIQNSLGVALAAIGVREADRAYLQQAVEAYREALKIRTRKRMPTEWANTQHHLGTALFRVAELKNDPETLKEAIAALEAALLERTPERNALQRATTQNTLGAALLRLPEPETTRESLEGAIAASQSALEIYEKAEVTHAANAARANLEAAKARLQELQGLGEHQLDQRF
jgi:tetratricopeptide (TPR) repeat protein